MNNTATTEDRIWAVISHLSAIAFGMGILLPIIGWVEQRRKSNYASFQCLQALGYQSLGYTIWLLSYLLIMIVLLIVWVAMLGYASDDTGSIDRIMGTWTAIFILISFASLGFYFLFPIIAAISCGLGKEFHYPILGSRLADYLGYSQSQKSDDQEWLIEDHEFRWVVAMGHFSIIIALWGMLAPLTTWLTQGKQNLFLKFQSIQTLIIQAVALILYFVAVFVYLSGFFLLFATMGFMETQFGSSTGMFSLILFGVISLVAIAIFLLIPLLHILGQWAGYRVLKGDDYHYPFIGRLVEGWIANTNSLQPPSSAAEMASGES